MTSARKTTELLAPAGSPECGYAALQYGADAVYLGLRQFSARADAENFFIDSLADFVGHAHGLPRRRSVYVAMNTLLMPEELPQAAETLARLEELRVDAVIVQDLGLLHLIRTQFPGLRCHASTQMAIHNAEGAEAARRLGFTRVVLARELTLPEIGAVTQLPGIETEVFIHGALCYAYSGLCLLSSLLRGRSGNRGSCAYPCRNAFRCSSGSCGPGAAAASQPYVMSMKDLALDDTALELRRLGVSSLKIEGRKKSAVYVAAACHYYRGLLDGVAAPELEERRQQLQTVFSRPQTRFFMGNKRQNVVEPGLVGHLGAPIGKVEKIVRVGVGERAQEFLRFRPDIPLLVYDGLQLPVRDRNGKPFGFSVEKLLPVEYNRQGRPVFEVPAQTLVEVPLPLGHPHLEHGMAVYCASSQKAKQSFPVQEPKPGSTRRRQPVSFQVSLAPAGLTVTATLRGDSRTVTLAEPLAAAQNPAGTEKAVRQAFEKLGDTPFSLDQLELENPAALFAPASVLNAIRRQATAALEEIQEAQRQARLAIALAGLVAPLPEVPGPAAAQFLLKTDQFAVLADLQDSDLDRAAEVIFDLGREPLAALQAQLPAWRDRLGDKLRIALPVLLRNADGREHQELLEKLAWGLGLGLRRWQVANPYALTLLPAEADLTADWPLHCLNAEAARELFSLGCRRITISPEVPRRVYESLLPKLGPRAEVLLCGDLTLAFSQACVMANQSGACPGLENCQFRQMDLTSEKGERLVAVNHRCRSVFVAQDPFSLARHRQELESWGARFFRIDLLWRAYPPGTAAALWRQATSGGVVSPSYEGNYSRTLG